MGRFLTTLMAVMLLSCFIAATAEAYDITGDWTMDYFGIPMVWSFHPEGNFEGIIDMDIPVADDGFNGITGLWTFDGETLTISDDTFPFRGGAERSEAEGFRIIRTLSCNEILRRVSNDNSFMFDICQQMCYYIYDICQERGTWYGQNTQMSTHTLLSGLLELCAAG